MEEFLQAADNDNYRAGDLLEEKPSNKLIS
jgi:hypothetical protein